MCFINAFLKNTKSNDFNVEKLFVFSLTYSSFYEEYVVPVTDFKYLTKIKNCLDFHTLEKRWKKEFKVFLGHSVA